MTIRSRASERQRRLRARQRRGDIVAPVEVSNEILHTLLDLGWLPEAGSENRNKIGDAITRMLSDLAQSHQRKIP